VVNEPSPRPKLPGSVKGLALALGLLAIGALQGGIAMVMDPNEPLGMTLEVLSDAPVDSFLLPGIFLLAMAVAAMVTLVGLVSGWDWPWARRMETSIGARWPWPAALAIGFVLLAFEVLELVMVPFHPIMHPLLIGLALVIIGLASTPTVRRYLEPESSLRSMPDSKRAAVR
jgi:hypothetical protein